MISLAHIYQEFGDQVVCPNGAEVFDSRDIDSEKLQSFDEGYGAGWEDSVKAQDESQQKISSSLAANLKDISFSYHEAQSALTQALRPLFDEILNKLLPDITRATIGPHIVEQLSGLVRETSDQAIEIFVSVGEYEFLNDLLAESISAPFVLLSKADLADGQINLRLGTQEREIDFEQMIQEIRESTNNLFSQE